MVIVAPPGGVFADIDFIDTRLPKNIRAAGQPAISNSFVIPESKAKIGKLITIYEIFQKKEKRNIIESVKQLKNKEIFEKICEFNLDRAENSYPPDLVDLAFLYLTACRSEIRRVVEIGSGASTLIFWEALRDKRDSSFLSLDFEPGWSASTTASVGKICGDGPEVTVVELEDYRYDDSRAIKVPKKLVGLDIDVLYLDGTFEGDATQGFQFLLYLMREHHAPFTVIIDGRVRGLFWFVRFAEASERPVEINSEGLSLYDQEAGTVTPIFSLNTVIRFL